MNQQTKNLVNEEKIPNETPFPNLVHIDQSFSQKLLHVSF